MSTHPESESIFPEGERTRLKHEEAFALLLDAAKKIIELDVTCSTDNDPAFSNQDPEKTLASATQTAEDIFLRPGGVEDLRSSQLREAEEKKEVLKQIELAVWHLRDELYHFADKLQAVGCSAQAVGLAKGAAIASSWSTRRVRLEIEKMELPAVEFYQAWPHERRILEKVDEKWDRLERNLYGLRLALSEFPRNDDLENILESLTDLCRSIPHSSNLEVWTVFAAKDMATALDQTIKSLQATEHAIQGIHTQQQKVADPHLSLSATAAFLAGVSAQTLQYSVFNNVTSSFLQESIYVLWYLSLSTSIFSAIFSLEIAVLSTYPNRLHDGSLPKLLRKSFKLVPMISLGTSGFLLLLGLALFAYAAFSALAVKILASVLSAVFILILVGNVCYFLAMGVVVHPVWEMFANQEDHLALVDYEVHQRYEFLEQTVKETYSLVRSFFRRLMVCIPCWSRPKNRIRDGEIGNDVPPPSITVTAENDRVERGESRSAALAVDDRRGEGRNTSKPNRATTRHGRTIQRFEAPAIRPVPSNRSDLSYNPSLLSQGSLSRGRSRNRKRGRKNTATSQSSISTSLPPYLQLRTPSPAGFMTSPATEIRKAGSTSYSKCSPAVAASISRGLSLRCGSDRLNDDSPRTQTPRPEDQLTTSSRLSLRGIGTGTPLRLSVGDIWGGAGIGVDSSDTYLPLEDGRRSTPSDRNP